MPSPRMAFDVQAEAPKLKALPGPSDVVRSSSLFSGVVLETILLVVSPGRYLVGNATVGSTGTAALRAGDVVPVLFRDGFAIAILAADGRTDRCRGADVLVAGGAVEELIVLNDADKSVFFRNDRQLTKIERDTDGNPVNSPFPNQPVNIRWGFGGRHFTIFRTSGAGTDVYELLRPGEDKVLGSARPQVRRVRHVEGDASDIPDLPAFMTVSVTASTATFFTVLFGVRSRHQSPTGTHPVGLNTNITVTGDNSGSPTVETPDGGDLRILSHVADIWVAPNGDLICRVVVEVNNGLSASSIWRHEYIVNERTRQVMFTIAPSTQTQPGSFSFTWPTGGSTSAGFTDDNGAHAGPFFAGFTSIYVVSLTVQPSVSKSLDISSLSPSSVYASQILEVLASDVEGTVALTGQVSTDVLSALESKGLFGGGRIIPQIVLEAGGDEAVVVSGNAVRALWYARDAFEVPTTDLRMTTFESGVTVDVGTDPVACDPHSDDFNNTEHPISFDQVRIPQFVALAHDFIYNPRESTEAARGQFFARVSGFNQQAPQVDGAVQGRAKLKKLPPAFPTEFDNASIVSDALSKVAIQVVPDKRLLRSKAEIP